MNYGWQRFIWSWWAVTHAFLSPTRIIQWLNWSGFRRNAAAWCAICVTISVDTTCPEFFLNAFALCFFWDWITSVYAPCLSRHSSIPFVHLNFPNNWDEQMWQWAVSTIIFITDCDDTPSELLCHKRGWNGEGFKLFHSRFSTTSLPLFAPPRRCSSMWRISHISCLSRWSEVNTSLKWYSANVSRCTCPSKPNLLLFYNDSNSEERNDSLNEMSFLRTCLHFTWVSLVVSLLNESTLFGVFFFLTTAIEASTNRCFLHYCL